MVRAGGDRRRLGRCLAFPSDVPGREGEPPCEPAGIGEGSDGFEQKETKVTKGWCEPAGIGEGSDGFEQKETKVTKGWCEPAGIGEGSDGFEQKETKVTKGWCEPAGIGEGSDGASPSYNGSIPTTRAIDPGQKK